ncbi:MAG: 4-(cytidine 5'-diphospho)-2-C-methyl-D-erythritol kinase [Lachnospiraceae bacterium]|nr:4-(cytidine 5'-diphospho)-2-C-methyl-D-erythritol kinase [Lachnospiraceae bacterium]
MDLVKRKAYAKINLCLDVLGKREDGYHEVSMIMQTIGLCDDVTLRKQDEGISLSVGGSDLPADESNLAFKAAKLMKDTYDIKEGVKISLKKNIPIAAGLAGGSSDAAAVMLGMNELFNLGIDKDELCKLGVKIGADVPYCIKGGTYLAQGIGEKLTPLPKAPGATILIAKPDISVSTKEVYTALNVGELKAHPDVDGMTKAIVRHDLDGVIERMGNVLENVTIKSFPVIDEIKQLMKENGAENALMSGSGPTVFGIFYDQRDAAECFGKVKASGLAKDVALTTFVTPD